MITIFYKQLTLNENGNNIYEKLNDKNYKRKVKRLHDAGLEKQFFTSDDVTMLGHGYGVSQYPQFYDQNL